MPQCNTHLSISIRDSKRLAKLFVYKWRHIQADNNKFMVQREICSAYLEIKKRVRYVVKHPHKISSNFDKICYLINARGI